MEFIKYNNETSQSNAKRMHFIESFLTVIDNNHEEIQFLISSKGSPDFNFTLAQLFIDVSGQRLFTLFGFISAKNKPLYAYYFGASMVGIIKFWIENYDLYNKSNIMDFILDLNQHIAVVK